MQDLPIDAWCRGLAELPEGGFVSAVNGYVQRFGVATDSVARYAFFRPDRYTRNLVFKNDLFEVLLLCWDRGTQSAIHNHRDQECWMVMVSGCLEVVNYRAEERDPSRGHCRLSPSSTFRITRKRPVGIDQDEPIHAVFNCSDRGERAMSVHVYSRPFDTCEIYDFVAQTYRDVRLHYDSVYGEEDASDAV
ncbi:MAG: hypothetical protein D6731_15245 [Planctomycetota bacterium]|nr:MAG: hypothetical protein D6731_15245 [Planctomycetota bacterium]